VDGNAGLASVLNYSTPAQKLNTLVSAAAHVAGVHVDKSF
jgi:hypothetical protein